jgi:hypothetical protein
LYDSVLQGRKLSKFMSSNDSAAEVRFQMSSRKVCYLISHGFSARMVLHSGLMDHLLSGSTSVQILTHAKGSQSLVPFEKDGLSVHGIAHRSSKWIANLADFKRYLREPIRQNAALWSRHQYLANGCAGSKARLIARFNYFAHMALHKSRLAQAVYGRIDRRLHRSTELIGLLERLRPDVLVSTYPVTAFEVSALLAAKELGIPTVGHLLSWDNITCKGKFTVVPDYFICWGNVMTSELKQHYGVAPERIFECGVPHFDAHRELIDASILSRELKRMGLSAERPYLFFGMSAPIFAPHEIDIVEHLAKEVRSGTFGADMQMIVRPHPQNVTGNMADASWLPRIRAIQGPRVGVNMPVLSDDGLAWNMDQGDLPVLVNLLSGCAVCLNSGSTLSIDAIAHDKPVVLTVFDADRDLPWWKSARRIPDYPHYRKLLEFKGVSPAGSFLELVDAIKCELEDPSHRQGGRQETIRQECFAIDGKSSQRVASAIAAICEAGSRLPV